MIANSKRIKPSMQASLFLPLLLGVSGLILPAPAQSPGTFTATGNMVKARTGHTATLLHDGKVLIAGGSDSLAYSAELYDPATGAFTATGDLLNPRSSHTATLLPDGKVLIAGGMTYYSSLDSAELYDPTTGTFTATGNMITYSSFHTAILLNSGHVLIAGGSNHNVSSTSGGDIEVTLRSSGELYDPAAGQFTATGSMTVPLLQPTATLLADGTVLVASPNWLPNGATSEVYSPLSGKFRRNNKGDGMSSNHRATILASGKVLLAGGVCHGCSVATAGAFLYDPANGTLTSTGSMIANRSWHAASLLPDGTVLITGGTATFTSELGATDSTEVYDPLTDMFRPTGNMTTRRRGHTSTLLNNGDVLITGGNKDRDVLASAELYHPSVLLPAPLIFSLSGDGNGQGAIWRSATGQVVSPGIPAFTGEVLSMYTTSFGEGSVIPPQVAIGGRLVEILFFGDAPGYPGFNQVNIRVPGGIAPGAAVPVRLTYLGRSSNEVTIAMQ